MCKDKWVNFYPNEYNVLTSGIELNDAPLALVTRDTV